MVPLPEISSQIVNRLKKYLQLTSFNDAIISVVMCMLHDENKRNKKKLFLYFHVWLHLLMG